MSASSSANNNVSLLLSKPVMKTMVLGTGVLAVKMLATNIYAVFPSVWVGFRPPEDSAMWKILGMGPEKQNHGAENHSGTRHADQHSTQAHSRYLRAQRVIMNDLENIPVGLVVFWVAALANPKKAGYISKLFVIFVGARCAHSAVYLAGMSSARSLAFATGVAATLRAMFLGVKGVSCSGCCKCKKG